MLQWGASYLGRGQNLLSYKRNCTPLNILYMQSRKIVAAFLIPERRTYEQRTLRNYARRHGRQADCPSAASFKGRRLQSAEQSRFPNADHWRTQAGDEAGFDSVAEKQNKPACCRWHHRQTAVNLAPLRTRPILFKMIYITKPMRKRLNRVSIPLHSSRIFHDRLLHLQAVFLYPLFQNRNAELG